jgi:cyclase
VTRVRIIPRLDIKGPNLIKGVHLEGLRVVGDPHTHALRYYTDGADELIFMDVVASLYQRNNLTDIIKRAADQVFVPITVGGGVRSVADVGVLLHSGADKVAINTAATKRPALLSEIAQRFGSQCVVLSVEAKRRPEGGWEAYTDNGRERTGREVVAWVREAVGLGVGEVLVTSVDQEGTRRGFDVDLLAAVCAAVRVPVIASGGYGRPEHLAQAAAAGVTGLAVADALHWARITLPDLKAAARGLGLHVRETAPQASRTGMST